MAIEALSPFSVQPQPLGSNLPSPGPIIQECEEPMPSSAQCQSLSLNSSSTAPIAYEYVKPAEGQAKQDQPTV